MIVRILENNLNGFYVRQSAYRMKQENVDAINWTQTIANSKHKRASLFEVDFFQDQDYT